MKGNQRATCSRPTAGMATADPAPRTHREALLLDADELLHPLEAKVFQLAQELTQPVGSELGDDEVVDRLNTSV